MPEDIRTILLSQILAEAPAALFQFDERIKDGWLSDRYFLRTAETLRQAGKDPIVTLQVFAKKDGVVAGLAEGIRLLQTQLAEGARPEEIEVSTLLEGDAVAPWETIMLIKGPYRRFAHLETPLLGVLARRSLVASNVRKVVKAANGKPVIFMAARHDDWRVQTPDGYAAKVGGIGQVSSDAGGSWWGERGVGTMPHALIGAMGGDTVEATLAFTRCMQATEPNIGVISLVDYDNDVVATSLSVARAMRQNFGPGILKAVRVDTSEKLVDKSLLGLAGSWGKEAPTGVTPGLVKLLRGELDRAGFSEVGIVVSGGFTPEKIAKFERENVPVIAYGVGSSLLGHSNGSSDGLLTSFDFTADIVEVDGKTEAKVGRGLNPNNRLAKVDWTKI